MEICSNMYIWYRGCLSVIYMRCYFFLSKWIFSSLFCWTCVAVLSSFWPNFYHHKLRLLPIQYGEDLQKPTMFTDLYTIGDFHLTFYYVGAMLRQSRATLIVI